MLNTTIENHGKDKKIRKYEGINNLTRRHQKVN